MTTFFGSGGVILVGEAPNKSSFLGDTEGTNALEIPRLAGLCGISMEAFLGLFVRVNLLDEWPGRAIGGKGDVFPRPLAVEGAKKIKSTFFPTCWAEMIVLLGRRVQDAFLDIQGRRPPGWFEEEKMLFRWDGEATTRIISVVTAPHPSGVSSWWNDPKNVKMTSDFWIRVRTAAIEHMVGAGPNPDDKNPYVQSVCEMIRDDRLYGKSLLVACAARKAIDPSFDWKAWVGELSS